MSSGPVTAVVIEGQRLRQGLPGPRRRHQPDRGGCPAPSAATSAATGAPRCSRTSCTAPTRTSRASARSPSGSPSSDPPERRTPRVDERRHAPRIVTPVHFRHTMRDTRPMLSGARDGRDTIRAMTTWPALGRDLAIDLGTANTLIHVRGRGSCSRSLGRRGRGRHRPARRRRRRAKEMLGRAPGTIRAVRPAARRRRLRRRRDRAHAAVVHRPGAPVASRPPADGALRPERGHRRRAPRPRGRRDRCGARRVYMVEEPMAAAIGAGLPVHETPRAWSSTSAAARPTSRSSASPGIVTSTSLRTAGDEIDEALISHVKASTPSCSASAAPRTSRWRSARSSRSARS